MIGCNAVAVKVISSVREVANDEPCLLVTKVKEEADVKSGEARLERERRSVERGLYQELSRYYPRANGLWNRRQLLSQRKHASNRSTTFHLTNFPSVVQDLESHPALKASTQTTVGLESQ
jgi:hypothetical protein